MTFVNFIDPDEILATWNKAEAVPHLNQNIVIGKQAYNVFDTEWHYKNGTWEILVLLAPREAPPRKLPREPKGKR